MKKKILLITTGGTIAMKYNSPVGIVPDDEFVDHLRSYPQLENLAFIHVAEFSNIPSPYMNSELMMRLVRFVEDKIEDYDGVVITHGTDTLEESAYFLDLVLETQKPVVFTAAMRSGSELGLDGPRNIVGAVRVASCPEATGKGVLVVMNDEINAARDVVKTDSGKTNSFITPSYGLLGTIDPDRVIFYRQSTKMEKIKTKEIESNIDLIRCVSGIDGRYIECSLQHHAKAIVIEAFGRGNVPPTMVEPIKKAIAQNVLVVVVSRTYTGRVLPEYGYKGGGSMLQRMGVILGEDLKGHKMRIKLMVLFGKYKSVEKVKKYLLEKPI
ncbi:MAG: L-asparaginase [Candidatus Cloacimonadota bacterium]|jgi:L-asparaginase|nr:L-asparaginase [Candidatus Cloacimonadota bacterium]